MKEKSSTGISLPFPKSTKGTARFDVLTRQRNRYLQNIRYTFISYAPRKNLIRVFLDQRLAIKVLPHLPSLLQGRNMFFIKNSYHVRDRTPDRCMEDSDYHYATIHICQKHNIRTDFKEIAVNTMNGIHSAQDRAYWRSFVIALVNFRVP